MRDLKVALIQNDIIWEDIEGNLSSFDRKLELIGGHPDVVVLPEMFSTGFTMNVDRCAETEDGNAVMWLRKKSEEKNFVVSGSLLIRDNKRFYNRFFWMKPNGNYETYDKRHLFRMSNEHTTMSAGMDKKIVQLYDWKFSLQICYDLRFPVWSKNNFTAGQYAYDVLIYVANWPEIRNYAYKSLLIARAIENQCYVIWVNRVGYDSNQIFHSGDSMVVDPYGKIIFRTEPGKEEILQAVLSGQDLTNVRTKFMIGNDWDTFTVHY